MWFDRYLPDGIGYEYFDAEGRVGIIDWDDEPYATITDLKAITKGAGFGTRLVEIAVEKAREIGVNRLEAIADGTEEARGFWNSMSSHGFEKVGDDRYVLDLTDETDHASAEKD